VFDSEDVVFAWAIGKALLIVIVSVGALVYIAWFATRTKSIAQVDISENGALSSSAVKANKIPPIGPGRIGTEEEARRILSGTSVDENNARKPEHPAVAA
jgi:hypothetical protein